MARKGTFGSKLTPFGGGGSLSDLSVYQLKPTYTAADPPPVPTVAPEAGVLPQPVLPRPTLPGIYLNPDTSAAREENAALGGAWRKGVLLAELFAAGG